MGTAKSARAARGGHRQCGVRTNPAAQPGEANTASAKWGGPRRHGPCDVGTLHAEWARAVRGGPGPAAVPRPAPGRTPPWLHGVPCAPTASVIELRGAGGGGGRTRRAQRADVGVRRGAGRGVPGDRRARARRVGACQRPLARPGAGGRRRTVLRHEPGRAQPDDPAQRLHRLRGRRAGGAVLRRPVLLARPARGARGRRGARRAGRVRRAVDRRRARAVRAVRPWGARRRGRVRVAARRGPAPAPVAGRRGCR